MAGWLAGHRSGGLAELRRRRVLRALGAYVVVGWLLLQVADVTFEPLAWRCGRSKALIIAVVAGVVPAAILAWVFDLTRHGLVRTPRQRGARARRQRRAAGDDAARPTSAAAGVGDRLDRGAAFHRPQPGAATTTGSATAWPRRSSTRCAACAACAWPRARASFRFRDGSVDPREIGKLLNVDAILEGSVRVAGERMRVTAQLIDAARRLPHLVGNLRAPDRRRVRDAARDRRERRARAAS